MLSKKVCKACYDRRYPESPWQLKDDTMWDSVGVLAWCPLNAIVFVSKLPPEGCPYLTEHLVSQDVE